MSGEIADLYLARMRKDIEIERKRVAADRQKEMSRRKAEVAELAARTADARKLDQIAAETHPDVVAERRQEARAQAKAAEALRRELDHLPSTSVFARFTPRRNRWKDVAEFDQRIDALERRRATLAAEIQQLEADRQAAELDHQRALTDWFAGGETGARPESRVPAIDALLVARRADQEASAPAVDRLLEEKIRYVDQHRRRLLSEAAKERAQAADRYRAAIADAARAREALLETRETEIWAACFPGEIAQTKAGFPGAICIGLQRPVAERLDGLQMMLQAPALFDLLQVDADTVAAMATPEQAKALGGREERTPVAGAMWAEDDDYKKWAKAETKRLRELGEWAHPAQLAQLGEEKRGL